MASATSSRDVFVEGELIATVCHIGKLQLESVSKCLLLDRGSGRLGSLRFSQ